MSEANMPDYAKMPEHEMPGCCGTNGAKWTDAFLQIHPGGSSDWGAMAGWFANAIEQGREAGRREGDGHKRERDEAYRALVDIRDAGRTATGQTAASHRAQAALDAISKMYAPSHDQAHGSAAPRPEAPTPEAGYQSLLRETAGGAPGGEQGRRGVSECALCGGSGIHRMANTWICHRCGGTGRCSPPQPAEGYTKNVTPRGPVVRPEDAFPESCCEGGPMEERDE